LKRVFLFCFTGTKRLWWEMSVFRTNMGPTPRSLAHANNSFRQGQGNATLAAAATEIFD